MINNFLHDKPDSVIAYQSLLYGINGKGIIGNAFLAKDCAIYIMYDFNGNFVDYDIQVKEG
jgi:hypothetical protein